MDSTIKLGEIYDHNLNFLIGSGASFGLLPTLRLKIPDDSSGSEHTVETLATLFDDKDPRLAPLFMHYYATCIEPAQKFNPIDAVGDATKQAVLKNYAELVRTLLRMLQRRKPHDKRCNIFTTNYDGCFQAAAEELLREGEFDFVLNDGARGFRRRYVHPRNFNTFTSQTGIFERHAVSIPQINLMHLHGSVYWKKDGSNILVDYAAQAESLLTPAVRDKLQDFSAVLMDGIAGVGALKMPEFTEGEIADFWSAYDDLPIVNPTKWKFHETVFEEHYYQMLRMFSYELEKPSTVLITFGFSFADEHILSLVRRSLSNPTLQVFVCCFNAEECARLSEQFKAQPNVRCISLEDSNLDFTAFNEKVLALPDSTSSAPPAPAAAAGAI